VAGPISIQFDPRSLARMRGRLQADYLIEVGEQRFYSEVTKTIAKRAKDNAPKDTGELQKSIKTKKVSKHERSVIAGAPHAVFVHEGTRPHWPPVDALRGWAKRHNIPAFLVARAISERGTAAVPFLTDAFNMTMLTVRTPLNDWAESVARKWGK